MIGLFFNERFVPVDFQIMVVGTRICSAGGTEKLLKGGQDTVTRSAQSGEPLG